MPKIGLEGDLRTFVKAFKTLIDEIVGQKGRENALEDITGIVLPEAKGAFPPELYLEIKRYAEEKLGVEIPE